MPFKTIKFGYVGHLEVKAIEYSGKDTGLCYYRILKGDFITNVHEKIKIKFRMGTVAFV